MKSLLAKAVNDGAERKLSLKLAAIKAASI